MRRISNHTHARSITHAWQQTGWSVPHRPSTQAQESREHLARLAVRILLNCRGVWRFLRQQRPTAEQTWAID